jgi:hypothetical protein
LPHEIEAGQAAGLMHAAMLAPSQLIALVDHGDSTVEMPLLWALCSAYVRAGHQVAVIDGSSCETPGNPGLLQICEGTYRQSSSADAMNDWLVLPAQVGLQANHLSEVPKDALPDLICGALPNRSVIILYAPARALASIFPAGQLNALVTLSPLPNSSVAAYEAIKLMWELAMIRATVISLEVGPIQVSENRDEGVCKNLRDCAMSFLGYRPDAFGMTIATRNEFEWATTMDKIAAFLLERSIRLPVGVAARTPFGGSIPGSGLMGWRH